VLNESLLSATILAPASLSVGAVIALVMSDWRDFRPGRYLFKPLAAVAFVWLALALGATQTGYGQWLLAGLLCCLAGDLLLMPDSDNFFLAGLIAFLCGHLFYAVTFLQLPLNATGMALTTVPAIFLLVLALRWLMPHVEQKMKLPVTVYTLVITAMLCCAGNSAGQDAALLIISGAWGFAISDLAVARRQFVKPSRWNGLWGTPLYFFSQMLLAYSVALA
jgi:uncharacterized membrane protein YhhN